MLLFLTSIHLLLRISKRYTVILTIIVLLEKMFFPVCAYKMSVWSMKSQLYFEKTFEPRKYIQCHIFVSP